MSYSLCLKICFDGELSLKLCRSILASVSGVHLEERGISSEFCRAQVFDRLFSKTQDIAPAGNLDEVSSFLDQYWSQAVQVSIDSVYPYFDYEEDLDAIVVSERPLTTTFNGAEYDDGYEQKRFGHVVIEFENINSFLGRHKLITNIAQAQTTEQSIKWTAMLAQINCNYEYVRRLIRAVMADARPKHLLSCTESDVNPLVAHDIYHARLEDFGEDLRRIAKLHEHGGVYFFDVPREDPAFLSPWKKDTYGYWRGKYGQNNSQELVRRLEPYLDRVLNGENAAISNEVLRDVCVRVQIRRPKRSGKAILSLRAPRQCSMSRSLTFAYSITCIPTFANLAKTKRNWPGLTNGAICLNLSRDKIEKSFLCFTDTLVNS